MIEKWEGHTICPKCGKIAQYNPYDKEVKCEKCGTFKDDRDNPMWLENLEK